MLYASIRQSDGYARIQSEVGRGTTLRVLLPRHLISEAEAENAVATSDPATAPEPTW